MEAESFVPPFLGVLCAFGLNYLYVWGRNRSTRRSMLIGIRGELERARDRLRELLGKTVPTDHWKLAVSSGQALLLKHEILSKLAEMYFALDNYTYEIKLVRRFSEQARQAVGSRGGPAKQKLAEVRWGQAVDMQKNLASAIDLLLKESFWPST